MRFVPLLAAAVVALAAAPAQAKTVWLCRPGMAHNPCTGDLTATVLGGPVERATPAKRPKVDCFYVYPTVSNQKTVNADLHIDPEQRMVAELQAARFSQVCRVWAPMYPQLTKQAINGGAPPTYAARAKAFMGVLGAWQDYLAHHNHGRGVVLIGHSQGTGMLTALVRLQIDPNARLRHRLVSALLIGGNVVVRRGSDRGGDFDHIPACRSARQLGCVVAYSAFSSEPPADALFGRVENAFTQHADPGSLQVLCTNPAALGGAGPLRSYFTRAVAPGLASTPWVAIQGVFSAHCASAAGADWLQVDASPLGQPTLDSVNALLGPAWGLHLVDVNLALGNLVDLVRSQAAAYTRRTRNLSVKVA